MNNLNNLILLGFPRCGSGSTKEWLGCQKDEIGYYPNAVELYKERYLLQGKRPVFTIRNPIERIISEYFYFGFDIEMGLGDYLRYTDPDRETLGFTTPILRSNYARFIEPFAEFKPIILCIETMSKIPGFPHRTRSTRTDISGGSFVAMQHLLYKETNLLKQYGYSWI